MSKLRGAISSDIDTLRSLYYRYGLVPEACGGPDFEVGLENFCRFLEPYGIQSTLFMVGQDFKPSRNHGIIRNIVSQGHEIANHTYTHPQGFRLLTIAQQEAEIAKMEKACQELTGQRPIGFRSPGWNISDDTLKILKKRRYLYDSSVFPTILSPVLKLLHWYNMQGASTTDRTTLGHWRYMTAPTRPFHTSEQTLSKPGDGGIIEFPITVTPGLRLPFFATSVLSTGIDFFKRSLKRLRERGYPLQFQFHLSDFVDYSKHGLSEEVPQPSDKVYVPKSFSVPLQKKTDLFKEVLELMSKSYEFVTLHQWARLGL